jgi:hypothetical protein
MKHDHSEAEFRVGVGWCHEILPPHQSRDETLPYGPNPLYVPSSPNWEVLPHPASCQCSYCIDRMMGRDR